MPGWAIAVVVVVGVLAVAVVVMALVVLGLKRRQADRALDLSHSLKKDLSQASLVSPGFEDSMGGNLNDRSSLSNARGSAGVFRVSCFRDLLGGRGSTMALSK